MPSSGARAPWRPLRSPSQLQGPECPGGGRVVIVRTCQWGRAGRVTWAGRDFKRPGGSTGPFRARRPRGGERSGAAGPAAATGFGPRRAQPPTRRRGVASGGLPPRPGYRGAVAVGGGLCELAWGGAVGGRRVARAAPRPSCGLWAAPRTPGSFSSPRCVCGVPSAPVGSAELPREGPVPVGPCSALIPSVWPHRTRCSSWGSPS